MSQPRSRVIAFDLDGTLVDSSVDIVASFRHAFGELGMSAPSADAVRSLIGRPLEEMYGRFAPGSRVSALAAAYRRHYPRNFARNTKPFPGVIDTLIELRSRGWLLAVATTKGSPVARALVGAVGLGALIDHVQGTDGFPHKPAPDVVLRAGEALGSSVAWMVGDTPADVVAGRAAGAATYAVTWGAGEEAQLREEGPDALESDLGRLLELALPVAT